MRQKTKALIIEDDKVASDYLENLLRAKVPHVEVMGTCETVPESIDAILKYQPDLVLMDIVLKDGQAFDVLDTIDTSLFEIIFITAHGHFMKTAFDYFAFTYLTKPYEDDDVLRAISQFRLKKQRQFDHNRLEILKDFIQTKGTKFLIHAGIEQIAVDLKEIIHCKSEGNYTQFFLYSGKTILASNPLKYYENILSFKGFYRLNRFSLVNVEHVKSIYKKEAVILSDDTRIGLTARNKEKLSQLVNRLNS